MVRSVQRRFAKLFAAMFIALTAIASSVTDSVVVTSAEQMSTLSTTVTGLVFNDYDVDGAHRATATAPLRVEPGVPNVTVRAFDATGTLVGTTVTASNGSYTLTITNASTNDVRVEFTVPDGYEPSFVGTSGSVVQFVSLGATNVNLGVHVPGEFCQANPLVACTIVDRTVDQNFQSLRTFNWNNSGSTTNVATNTETGAVWGLAWQQATGRLISAPTVRRNTKVYESPAGTPRLGQLFVSTTAPGSTQPYVDVSTLGVDVGSVPNWATRTTSVGGVFDGFSPNGTWDLTGKVGIGDIDVSEDGNYLWFVNLFDRSLYRLDIDVPLRPADEFTAAHVTRYELPDPGCSKGVHRPWAIATRADGSVYVGGVCTGENGGARADLEALVYRYNPTSDAIEANPVLRFSLNYTKENAHVSGLDNTLVGWTAWWDSPNTSGTWYSSTKGAMPILSDIEFTPDGSMTLGFLDRMAQRAQTFNQKGSGLPGRSGVTDWFWTSAGDILRACTADQQTWQIEPIYTTTVATAGCVVGGTTYFSQTLHSGRADSSYREFYNDNAVAYGQVYPGVPEFGYQGHLESATGGLATFPGATEVAGSFYDTNSVFFTSGVRWWSDATGRGRGGSSLSTGDRQLAKESSSGGQSFGKAGGVGDLEVLCDMAPLQIGNRVWFDVDGDGIQDPGEGGLANVTVNLYDTDGNVVATTTTNANGEYSFSSLTSNLQPYTAYTIRLDNPDDYADGGPLADYFLTKSNISTFEGSDLDDHIDSDAGLVGGTSYGTDRFPQISVAALQSGYNDHSYDFGFTDPQVSVGDRVWHDLDRDGVQDAGETGIAGVTLRLTYADGSLVTDLDGNLVTTTVADSNGNYLFDNLPPGQYKVVVDQPPSGYTASTPLEDTSVSLALGEEDLSLDFGFYTPKVSVGDKVWFDVDGDGVQDAGEPGIADVTMTITQLDGSQVYDVLGNAVTTTTTDANGSYSFPNLPLGQYKVTVAEPAGYTATLSGVGSPQTDSSTGFATSANLTTDGASDITLDFGFYAPTVSVGDRVWFDTNKDGQQDAGEPGIAGVILTITTADGDPVTDVFGNPVTTTTTDANGNYVFDNLPVGSYKVTASLPSGYIASTATSITSTTLSTDGASDMTLDFGIYASMVSVGDRVWLDADADGVQDVGESGIAGVTLTITTAAGGPVTDVFGNPVTTTTTDANGNYVFDQLPPGSYKVTVTDPAGLVPTVTGQGTTSTDSSDGFATSANLTVDGATDTSLDFGYRLPMVSVGDRVWLDADADGVQDAGESGIAGVTLTITTAAGGPVTDVFGNPVTTTTTDANGNYVFDNLPLGSYKVTVTDPSGLIPTQTGQGTTSTDSSTGSATSANLTVDGASDTTLDFGYRLPMVSVGDRVWFDTDGDGIQDEGERGIAGVTLTLLKSDGTPATDVAGNPVTTTTTDANGNYVFGNLPDGSYKVIVTPPNGYSATTALEFTSASLTGDGANDMTLDFGFNAPVVSVGNRVWFDSDGDGVQDAGERGIAGVELTITTANGGPVTDIFGRVVTTTTTDANGNYIFDNLPVGQYRVTVIDPTGYTATQTGAGSTETDSSTGSELSLQLSTDGASDMSLDFGYTAPVVWLGGTVWGDSNNDGTIAAGEAGLANITLLILNADGSPVVDVFGNSVTMTTTDANGNYRFDNLHVGEYKVFVVGPTGYSPTTSTFFTSGMLSTDGAHNATLHFGFFAAPQPIVQNTVDETVESATSTSTNTKTRKLKAKPSKAVTSQQMPVDFIVEKMGRPSRGARFVTSKTMIAGTNTSLWRTSISTPNGMWRVVDGVVRFVPNPGFVGSVTIRYRLTDSAGNVAVSTLTVTVGDQSAVLPSTGASHTSLLSMIAFVLSLLGGCLVFVTRRVRISMR